MQQVPTHVGGRIRAEGAVGERRRNQADTSSPALSGFLLMEDGSYLLQEDGTSKIVLEGTP